MNGEERGNKLQGQYGEHNSLFGESEKLQHSTEVSKSKIKEILWARRKVNKSILNKIGNKIDINEQRKGLYNMICLNHHCLENIAYSNGAMDEEILKGCQKLSENIKETANCIKPCSKNNANDNLNSNNFIETFRKFSLSKMKSRCYLEEIEQSIQNKATLTTKEGYLDKLLPYLSTDLDFIEQYFSFFTESQDTQEEISYHEQIELEEVDLELLFWFKEIGETIGNLKPRAYRKLFLKVTDKLDYSIYNCLKEIEEFQTSYKILQKAEKISTLEKYIIFSELLHIIIGINKGLKQGNIIYLKFKNKKAKKNYHLIKELEKTLLELDRHTRELNSINSTVVSSYTQEAIDFITDTAKQYSSIMKRLLEQSTLSEMKNY